jgi:hypothetical protein
MEQINSEVLHPPFKRTAEAQKLEEHLADKAIGELVSYEQIEQLIGEDPQRGSGYSIVYCVRKRLLKESAVWYPIPGLGLRRASPEEVLELVDDGFQSLRRKVARTGRVLNACDYEKLDTEGRHNFNSQRSNIGILGFLLKRPQQKQIKEFSLQFSDETFDPRNVLRLFGGDKKPTPK